MTKATVLKFHLDLDQRKDLVEALDGVAARYAAREDFQGLLCLGNDGPRSEIVVLALWDDRGFEGIEAEVEGARRRIAAVADLGVSSKSYEVLRLIPGPASIESMIAEALSHR